MTYPTDIDNLTRPNSSDPLNSPSHSDVHGEVADAVEAVETKLGTGASVPTTTGHVLTVTGPGATGYQAPTGGAPSGPAGGQLAGTYPNPSVAGSHSGSTHAATAAAAEAAAATYTDNEIATEAAARDAAIAAAIASLIDSSPGTLDTLNELAAALGDDPNFAASVTTALAGKQPLDSDLTAIAALTTTAFGRALLELANAAALRTAAGLVIGTDVPSQGAFDDHSARHEDGGADEISVQGLAGTPAALQTHLDDTTAHSAATIPFTPAGSIAATDVQAAIEEVAAEAGGGGNDDFLAYAFF